MMNLIAILLLTILPLHSATLDIIGACSKTPILSFNTSDKFETVGDLTVYYLTKNKVPFQGNERGINSILNSPLGLDAIEVLSDTQMRSYGWCYRVNGVVLDRYADEVILKPGDHIEWFYAYAWYDREWGDMCNPSYEIKSPWVCN